MAVNTSLIKFNAWALRFHDVGFKPIARLSTPYIRLYRIEFARAMNDSMIPTLYGFILNKISKPYMLLIPALKTPPRFFLQFMAIELRFAISADFSGLFFQG